MQAAGTGVLACEPSWRVISWMGFLMIKKWGRVQQYFLQ